MASRLTPHVRHRAKYIDVPISAHRAFVFNVDGQPTHSVRTLRQFVSELERTPAPLLEGYIVRGDFSRWIADVFGDRALADELRDLEHKYRTGYRDQTLREMVERRSRQIRLGRRRTDVERALSISHAQGTFRVRGTLNSRCAAQFTATPP